MLDEKDVNLEERQMGNIWLLDTSLPTSGIFIVDGSSKTAFSFTSTKCKYQSLYGQGNLSAILQLFYCFPPKHIYLLNCSHLRLLIARRGCISQKHSYRCSIIWALLSKQWGIIFSYFQKVLEEVTNGISTTVL